mmetsp:Transcript_51968/g.129358  ORF Transcript_51968/g.129358 Transcript_51968/m.129358 type:complete len:196 (+) Transcript_51968:156-743(+)
MERAARQGNVAEWLRTCGEDLLVERCVPQGGGHDQRLGAASPLCAESEDIDESVASGLETLHGSLMFLGASEAKDDGEEGASEKHAARPAFARANSCGQSVERAQLQRDCPFKTPRMRPRMDLHRPLLQSSLDAPNGGAAARAVLVPEGGEVGRHHDSRVGYNSAVGDKISSVVVKMAFFPLGHDGGGDTAQVVP